MCSQNALAVRQEVKMANKKKSVKLRLISGKETKISVLSNAVYYFFQRVFIVTENNSYRLIAIHNGEILVDEKYKTSKGAKIAFLKLYWYRAWQDGVKPEWTDFYTPDDEWLGDRFKLA